MLVEFQLAQNFREFQKNKSQILLFRRAWDEISEKYVRREFRLCKALKNYLPGATLSEADYTRCRYKCHFLSFWVESQKASCFSFLAILTSNVSVSVKNSIYRL